MEDGSVVNLEFNSKEDLMIQENNDAEVKVDIQKFFHTFAPQTTDPSMSYPQHTYEGPNNMPAHIKSLLLQTHLSITVSRGQLLLGRWQGIYLFEHRNAPHTRSIIQHLST